jgi:predicted ArsR family transcriptional regulator
MIRATHAMETTVSDIKLDILRALKRRGTMTVDELVEHFELSKTAIRAHLLRLEDDEMIERHQVPSNGPGRPPLAYRVTECGAEVFGSADSAVLTRLLDYLEREEAMHLVQGFFEELWSDRLAEYRHMLNAEENGSASLQDRLEVLEELLSTHDFMPVVDTRTGEDGAARVTVRECNCPFPAAVRATRSPCRLEAKFLAEVLGAQIQRTSFASKRSETCLFEFEVAAAEES